MTKKKIIIDARQYGPEHTGIGRYIKGLLEHLPVQSGIEVVVVTHPKHLSEKSLIHFRTIPASAHPYSFLSQFELHRILIWEKPDLIHIPHFTVPILWPGKIVVTIHDLIKHESTGPQTTTHSPLFYWVKYLGYRAVVRLAATRAAHIITPSHYWKRKLIERFHLPTTKVSVTYEGVDNVFFHPKFSTFNSQLSTPYLIYVGNVYPHKNVGTLVRATRILNGKVHLYISCSRNIFWDRTQKLIQTLKAEKYVTHLGFVPDPELATLYRNSLAFVTASKIEGLGLPGLEAMAAQTAVISSNSSCLPETYGSAALYFNPDKPEELAEEVRLLLGNSKIRQDLVAKGKIQVSKFSWQKMADRTWQIYNQELNS